jgi:hypothetical protein
LFRKIKQHFCKHSFQITKTYTDDGDETIGYKPTEFAIIYCPKCKKQQTCTLLQFEVMKEMQRIDKEYADEQLRREEDNRQS